MVTDDARDIHVPFSGAVSCQKIIKTMAHFADENGHPRPLIVEVHGHVHAVAFSEKPVHRILDVFPPDNEVFQLPFKSHEKVLFDRINVLVDIYDVS